MLQITIGPSQVHSSNAHILNSCLAALSVKNRDFSEKSEEQSCVVNSYRPLLARLLFRNTVSVVYFVNQVEPNWVLTVSLTWLVWCRVDLLKPSQIMQFRLLLRLAALALQLPDYVS